MAFRYVIYSTGTTFAGTIFAESITSPAPSALTASYNTDFMIPEIQPLYLWQVIGTGITRTIIPNTDANINTYLDSIAPPHTPNDVVLWDDLTGATSQKIDTVTGATDKIAIFTADGNLQDGGYTIPELTGLTTYTFVASGGTHINQVGNTVTISSTVPTGTTVNWGGINGDITIQTDLWNNLTYLSGATTGNTAAIQENLELFTGYTASTQPIIDGALTGATDAGTGITLISGIVDREVVLKTISVIGGLSFISTGDTIIISGDTGGITSVSWGQISGGTVSDQTDLWQILTGMTAETATKLDISVFTGYTAATQPILDAAITGVTNLGSGTTLGDKSGRNITLKSIDVTGGLQIISGTGDTLIISGETNVTPTWGSITGVLSDQEDLWNELTGLTADIATKLDIATFTGYTGTTQTLINSKVTKVTGATQNNIVVFGVGGEVVDSGVQIRTDVRPLSAATDSYVPTEQAVREAINNAISGYIILQGEWNATTNVPNLTVTGISTGFAWRVSVSGNTNLGGITDWQVGDLAVKTDGGWLKIDNSDIAALWGNIGGDISDQTDLWNILTGTTAETATKLDTAIFTGYTATTQPIIDGALTGATNGLTKVGRDATLGGDLTGNVIINGLGTHDLFITNIDEFQINTSGNSTVFGVDNDGLTFIFTGGSVNFTDNGGLKYAADYSSGFTARSLVDVEYVTGLTANLQSQIDFVSAATTANTSAIQANLELFTGYTASTEIRLDTIESDIVYISGVTSGNTQDIQENFELFTGYTANTKNKDKRIVLISSATTEVNIIETTPIPWNSVKLYDRTGAVITGTSDTYAWTGGSGGVLIKETGLYEIYYHVTIKNGNGAVSRSVGSYVSLNTTTTIDTTASAAVLMISSAKEVLTVPPVIVSLNANDVLHVIAFRVTNSGSVVTVPNSVFFVINRLA